MNANHKSRAVVIAGLIALIVAAVAFVRVSRTAGDSDQRERDTRADDSVPKAMAGFAKPMPTTQSLRPPAKPATFAAIRASNRVAMT